MSACNCEKHNKKQVDLVYAPFFGAVSERFLGSGEHHTNPRVFWAGRVGGRGEGRERGNFIETTPKAPVAQRAAGICAVRKHPVMLRSN